MVLSLGLSTGFFFFSAAVSDFAFRRSHTLHVRSSSTRPVSGEFEEAQTEELALESVVP